MFWVLCCAELTLDALVALKLNQMNPFIPPKKEDVFQIYTVLVVLKPFVVMPLSNVWVFVP